MKPTHLVDVRDAKGHLIFKYDPVEDIIEIKSRGIITKVILPELKKRFLRELIEKPVIQQEEDRGKVSP